MSVFERIKKLADKKGKSMQAVAEENGFSSNLFYRWKKTDPKGKDLAQIADYFNTTTDYLLGRTDNSSLPDAKEKTNDLADDVLFTYQGKKIPESDMKYIRDLLKRFDEHNE
ncbi:helix-turn-helix transcriptional regulator [Lactobacillus crispatus]|uniref:helix-turn-helix domain-containing protein n=1 Tax=Lactobacillus crispatus TaxID=47770 RepID=UPI0030F54D16